MLSVRNRINLIKSYFGSQNGVELAWMSLLSNNIHHTSYTSTKLVILLQVYTIALQKLHQRPELLVGIGTHAPYFLPQSPYCRLLVWLVAVEAAFAHQFSEDQQNEGKNFLPVLSVHELIGWFESYYQVRGFNKCILLHESFNFPQHLRHELMDRLQSETEQINMK